MLDRMDWAYQRRDRYEAWCSELLASPYSTQDKLEFAVLSAHTQFLISIAAFQATRAPQSLQDIAGALDNAGVMNPRQKAVYLTDLRALAPEPTFAYSEYRAETKLPGLGYCKLSFACCLIDPLRSDVVCIDTHVAKVYGEDAVRLWRTPSRYEATEERLKAEATEVGLPPFAYQWAVWDWKRLHTAGLSGPRVNSHSFLWQTPEYLQLPLFSGMEAG